MALRQFIANNARAVSTRSFATSNWWKSVEMGPKDPSSFLLWLFLSTDSDFAFF
jgi:hypothetical protein